LKVSRRSVYQWLHSGKLNGLKAGQYWRIAEDDLIGFMKQQKPAHNRRQHDDSGL
jgi:excisionase family DNA binding protein